MSAKVLGTNILRSSSPFPARADMPNSGISKIVLDVQTQHSKALNSWFWLKNMETHSIIWEFENMWPNCSNAWSFFQNYFEFPSWVPKHINSISYKLHIFVNHACMYILDSHSISIGTNDTYNHETHENYACMRDLMLNSSCSTWFMLEHAKL